MTLGYQDCLTFQTTKNVVLVTLIFKGISLNKSTVFFI
jgi:hypothetical protein